MTQRARDAINGFYALLIWFIENAVQQMQNTKAYFLTWDQYRFYVFGVIFGLVPLHMSRYAASCVYLTVFLIGSPFSYGESDILSGVKNHLGFPYGFLTPVFHVKHSLPDYSSGKSYRGRYFRKRMHVLYTNDSL